MCEHKMDRRAGKIWRAQRWGCLGARRPRLQLAITCIDYRLVDDAVRFFDSRHMTNDYDQVSLAGASLAGVSNKFPSSNAAFWDHIGIAKQLHHIQKVIVVDHRDCGAFKVAFGKDYEVKAQPRRPSTGSDGTGQGQMAGPIDLTAIFTLWGSTAGRRVV